MFILAITIFMLLDIDVMFPNLNSIIYPDQQYHNHNISTNNTDIPSPQIYNHTTTTSAIPTLLPYIPTPASTSPSKSCLISDMNNTSIPVRVSLFGSRRKFYYLKPDYKHRILACTIPKCGLTYFSHWLDKIISINITEYNSTSSSDKRRLARKPNKIQRGQKSRPPRYPKHRVDRDQLHHPKPKPRTRKNKTRHHQVDMKEYQSILFNDTWIKFVSIRDPLERLLSGYLDKCVHARVGCFGNSGIVAKDFSKFVDRLYAVIKKYENNCGRIQVYQLSDHAFNHHYRPQYWYCNLDTFYPHYNHVVQYNHANIKQDSIDLLVRAIGSDYAFYHAGEFGNESFYERFARKHESHITTKLTNSNNSELEHQIKFYGAYYTKELAKKVVDLYHLDYELFNLSVPKWTLYIPSAVEDVSNVSTPNTSTLNTTEMSSMKNVTYNISMFKDVLNMSNLNETI